MKTLEKKLEKETDMIKRGEILNQLQELYQVNIKNKIQRSSSGYLTRKYVKSKMTVISVFDQIIENAIRGTNMDAKEILTKRQKLTNHECYVPIVDFIIQKCFSLRVNLIIDITR